MLRHIVGLDDRARAAHHTAADTPADERPEMVAKLDAEHRSALARRHTNHQKTQRAQRDRMMNRSLELHRDRGRERDQANDLSL
jgi:hypothetical protein